MRVRGLISALGVCAGLAPVAAHASVGLVNGQGATAPCIGIGPIGGPAAERCGQMFEAQGFVRDGQVGFSGVTVGTLGADDGVVTAVAPGSPAAQAGIAPGDVVVAVDGHAVKPTAAEMAEQRLFGRRGDKLKLTVRRAGAEREAALTLAPATAPPAPKWDGVLVANRTLIDWRGEFVPCVGIGPLAIGVLAYCSDHFKKWGYISAADLGGSGLTLDHARADRAATVSAVAPGSPADQAGLAPGDVIVAVGGQPLAASSGEVAADRLFGKAGDVRRLTVRRGAGEVSATLTLTPMPKGAR